MLCSWAFLFVLKRDPPLPLPPSAMPQVFPQTHEELVGMFHVDTSHLTSLACMLLQCSHWAAISYPQAGRMYTRRVCGARAVRGHCARAQL